MSRGRKPTAAQVRQRVAARARERKWEDGATVMRIFRQLFEKARADGRGVTEAGKTAGLGTAVFMAIAGLDTDREPSPEVWDTALKHCVEVMAGQLTPERMQAALEGAAEALVLAQGGDGDA